MVSPATLVGLLGEEERLRVVAALVLGATTADDLLVATGLAPRELGAALRRLESGGLVGIADGQVRLNAGLFKDAARAAAPDHEPEDFGATDPKVTAVLRSFLRGGRLVQMPTTASKRRVVLEYLASVFEPGVRYPEREVNAILSAWYGDYASLRRYLVDEGLLARDAGEYWRIGGWVDLAGEPAQAPPREPAAVERMLRLGAYAVIRDGDQVLLTRFARGKPEGLWSLPGGGVEFGEAPPDAVVREVYEETGLHVRLAGLLDVTSVVRHVGWDGQPLNAQFVGVIYRAEVTGGTLGVTEVDGSTDAVQWWPAAQVGTDHRISDFAREVLARW